MHCDLFRSFPCNAVFSPFLAVDIKILVFLTIFQQPTIFITYEMLHQ